ncbi:MAG TPA: hypothetical protein DCZ91_12915 [Lachnospiraceae bacterium]|nr:hypothetical protein [Lachnospiraceae bacterium]
MALTNDDLLAISHLLDVKLKAEIQPIKNEMHSMKAELQGEIQAVKVELHDEIQAVKAELHDEIQAVKAELHGEIEVLQAEVHQIKLFQENVIMPQLNTIQSCYTSTYNRYKDSVEGYEALQADNELMKQIIMQHSEQLQKLA